MGYYDPLFDDCDGLAPGERESAVTYLENTAGEQGYAADELETEITDSGGLEVSTSDGATIFDGSSSIIFNCLGSDTNETSQTLTQTSTPEPTDTPAPTDTPTPAPTPISTAAETSTGPQTIGGIFTTILVEIFSAEALVVIGISIIVVLIVQTWPDDE